MNYLSIILFFYLLMPGLFQRDEKMLLNTIQDAEVVVVAEVVEVHPAMGFWSGVLAAVQHVRYRVVEVLKGEIESKEIDAGHYVVHNSLTADKETPQLSPELFRPGNRLILSLSRERGHDCKLDAPEKNIEAFCSPSENYGAVPAEEQLADKIRNDFKGK